MAKQNYNTTFAGAEEAALIGGQELKNLMYFGKLQNVKIINAKEKANPYTGKMNLDYTRDAPLGLSSIGTPVYSDLTLKGLTYTDNITGRIIKLKNNQFRTGQGIKTVDGDLSDDAGFYMNFETVIITVSQATRIVKTNIQGRNGSVKEYIGLDDATLNINGIITGQNGVYPYDKVKGLKDWLDAPVSKSIVARWLSNLGIFNIVVESYNIPQTPGGYSYQTFSINAISDLPVELKISQPVI